MERTRTYIFLWPFETSNQGIHGHTFDIGLCLEWTQQHGNLFQRSDRGPEGLPGVKDASSWSLHYLMMFTGVFSSEITFEGVWTAPKTFGTLQRVPPGSGDVSRGSLCDKSLASDNLPLLTL